MAVPARPLFILIVGLGSFLLFLVQPLIARAALPQLGGAPAVWNTAMLFYQGALLLGYLYAHALQRLTLQAQIALHMGVLLAAAATLPLSLPVEGGPPPGEEALWLLARMALGIGPLFVAVAAQAPLMQAWFARSPDPEAVNPWFLYAASNAGSLAGLLAYPFLLEPFLGLSLQRLGWSAGYAGLVALVGMAAMGLWREGRAMPAAPLAAGGAQPRLGLARQARWVALAAVPSGLMLSTTTHITTDIMAMPLLWVLPLSLYLLSFILAFGHHGATWGRRATIAAPFLLLVFGGAGFLSLDRAATLYGLSSLLLLAVVATALHGAVAADRPAVRQLTRFYLMLALGGMLGGLFAALLAPLLFDWVYEHPILLLLAALLVPARPLTQRIGRLWIGRGPVARGLRVLAPPVSLALSWWLGANFSTVALTPWMVGAVALIVALAVLAIGRPFAFTFHFLMLMLALGGWQQIDISTVRDARVRSFFGVYAIQNVQSSQTRRLQHGTTMHGIQSLDPMKSRIPMSYYAPESGVGLAFQAAPALFGPGARMGFVGLGAGSLACYARPGQAWTVFEIDPAIVDLTIGRRAFTYVAQCKPDIRIVLGDARLTLARAPKGSFDMLAVDAFSSDSIPLHLLTVEALRTYMAALQAEGVLLIHISNRFLDLEPVVAALVRHEGLAARRLLYFPRAASARAGLSFSGSDWVAVTRTEEGMARFLAAAAPGPEAESLWGELDDSEGRPAWTDERASILPALKPLAELLS
ncbi:spermidine synthase [Thermaurantiacus sp.]